MNVKFYYYHYLKKRSPFPLHQVGCLCLTEYNKLSPNNLSPNEYNKTSPSQAHDVGMGE